MGVNLSPTHLRSIIALADRLKVILIADEIYGHMTWGSSFVPMARLSETVPILTISGLSKRFLVPGGFLLAVCHRFRPKQIQSVLTCDVCVCLWGAGGRCYRMEMWMDCAA